MSTNGSNYTNNEQQTPGDHLFTQPRGSPCQFTRRDSAQSAPFSPGSSFSPMSPYPPPPTSFDNSHGYHANMGLQSPVLSPTSHLATFPTLSVADPSPDVSQVVALQRELARLKQQYGTLAAENQQLRAARGRPSKPAVGPYPGDWNARASARYRLLCSANRAGNSLCQWHDSRRERRAHPARHAPEGFLNCGCEEADALFEETLARHGVGSYKPSGNSVRMDPELRRPLRKLLESKFGYVDGMFDLDPTQPTGWIDGQDAASCERRLAESGKAQK